MNNNLINIIKIYICNVYNNTLYRNSFYIICASLVGSGMGFLFWTLSARLYSQEEVGMATALFSSLSLLILLSRGGLDQTIIRYLPNYNKSNIYSTSIIITSCLILSMGIVFLLLIDPYFPSLDFIKDNSILFLAVLILCSLFNINGITFIGLRKSKYYLIQNITFGIRVIFLFLLINYGKIGIFSSIGIAYLISLMISTYYLYLNGIGYSYFDKIFICDTFKYLSGNYVIGLLITLPNTIIPLIVLNVLGPNATAQYYISYSLVAIVYLIPTAISTSLFVEGSYGKPLKKNTIKSIYIITSLLIILNITIFIFGKYMLAFMGEEYLEAYNLIKILLLTSIFISIYQIYYSIKRVHKDTNEILIISIILFCLLLGLSYFLMNYFGLLGVGYAWFFSYSICTIFIIISVLKNKWI